MNGIIILIILIIATALLGIWAVKEGQRLENKKK